MRLSMLFLVLILGSSSLRAQTELEPFNKVDVAGNIELVLVRGDRESYTAENNVDMLKVRVEKGHLRISLKHSERTWDSPTTVRLTYKDIDYLYASAGASVEHDGVFYANDLELFSDAGARVRLECETKSINAQVGEGGLAKLSGKTHVLTVKSTTGAIFKGGDLIAETVFANANTGGQASVYASEVIEAAASMGGMISYEGNPEKQKISETLGGSVRG